MSEPFVMVFPRGQLSELDKARLESASIIAVEADDPSQVKQLQLVAPMVCTTINGDLLVQSALAALVSRKPHDNNNTINSVGMACHEFVRMLSAGISGQPDTTESGKS